MPICNANCLLFLHYSLKNKTEKLNCILYFSRVDHVPLNINKNKIYASSPSSSLLFIDCAVNKREISFLFLVYFSFFALVLFLFYFVLFLVREDNNNCVLNTLRSRITFFLLILLHHFYILHRFQTTDLYSFIYSQYLVLRFTKL